MPNGFLPVVAQLAYALLEPRYAHVVTGEALAHFPSYIFQIGGDRVGWRSEVDYVLAPEQVDLLDWNALG